MVVQGGGGDVQGAGGGDAAVVVVQGVLEVEVVSPPLRRRPPVLVRVVPSIWRVPLLLMCPAVVLSMVVVCRWVAVWESMVPPRLSRVVVCRSGCQQPGGCRRRGWSGAAPVSMVRVAAVWRRPAVLSSRPV